MPPLIPETAVKGNTRFPADVLTISEATRERSSCGAMATSRTRPLAAPEVSYTVEPNSSHKDTVAMLKRILKSAGGRQMNEIAPSKKTTTTEGTGVHWETQRGLLQLTRYDSTD